MGRTLWADGEILLASSAERRAASALVLVEPVGGVGPQTRRLPRHAYAGSSTNPLIPHANIPSAHKLQPDAAHSAPTQPPVIKRKSRCSRLPLRGVRCAHKQGLHKIALSGPASSNQSMRWASQWSHAPHQPAMITPRRAWAI